VVSYHSRRISAVSKVQQLSESRVSAASLTRPSAAKRSVLRVEAGTKVPIAVGSIGARSNSEMKSILL